MASLLVWGEHAEPILTGAYQPSDVAMAAAELQGQGRLVAFSHIKYGLQFLDNTDEKVMIQSSKIWWPSMLECNISPLGLQKI